MVHQNIMLQKISRIISRHDLDTHSSKYIPPNATSTFTIKNQLLFFKANNIRFSNWKNKEKIPLQYSLLGGKI